MLKFLRKGRRQKIHFLHIGKTGGTAIKSALNDHRKTRNFKLKLHGHGTSLNDIPKGESVVFFLRDPISRFISGFYSRQRKGQPRYYSEWSPKEKEVFENFSTPNEVAVSLADRDASAIRAMKNVQHFRKYKDWYVDFDYFNSRREDVFFVGFQETLDDDFEKLKDALGIPIDLSLPTDDIGAHKNPDSLDKSIDKKGVAALQEWYSEDFKFISLCRKIMSNKG